MAEYLRSSQIVTHSYDTAASCYTAQHKKRGQLCHTPSIQAVSPSPSGPCASNIPKPMFIQPISFVWNGDRFSIVEGSTVLRGFSSLVRIQRNTRPSSAACWSGKRAEGYRAFSLR